MHSKHIRLSHITIKYSNRSYEGYLWLPCRVSPEREDIVDTDDCTEATEVVSARVLSVTNPPPSPSVWTVIFD